MDTSDHLLTPSERPKDECGVFGLYKHPEAAKITYFGLYALQHRGQESAGISVNRGINDRIFSHKGMGLVPDIFDMADLERIEGGSAIGHVRYSTTGDSCLANAQPFEVNHRHRSYALAHNGNLVNAHLIREELEEQGSIFQTTMDSEVFLHLFIKNLVKGDIKNAVIKAAAKIEGAYSMILLTCKGEIIGMKDPNGFRPLALGKLNGHYVLASETCAFDLIQAEFIRELEPGEIVIINEDGITSFMHPKAAPNKSLCIFEYIYFARPDSTIDGKNVYEMRKAHGRRLAQESHVDADLVMPFPDSGNYAAIGYAAESGIPFEMGMIRNHYVGRSFIQPTQSMRDFAVRVKLNPVRELIKGKDIIIIEDSIIRGTTAKTRVRALRELGAKKIHMRISCPPHKFPCYYGIDFSSKGELIASRMPLDDLTEYLELDSLHYLSIEGMLEASGVENPECNFCKACFDGSYPVPFDPNFTKQCMG
ncbi:MAG: amidophosphoribosyltransferase [Desulfobacter sp.]|nr:MAG: amidophosphoribosyltransferase [Desulfobacter sp.]